MSDAGDYFLDTEGSLRTHVDAKTVDDAIDLILTANSRFKWKRNGILNLKSKGWRPSAKTEAGDNVLYVCLTGAIPRYIASRMVEAFEIGFRIHVALTLDALYSPEVLEVLATVDAEVFLLEDERTKDIQSIHFMAAMADLNVPTEPGVRTQLCEAVYCSIGGGTSQQKGRRFEALLAYLLSQVADFRVKERNLRNDTQELDIILQIDSLSQRSWQQNVPYILVEAKNQKDPTPQRVVSGLMSKIRIKGQSCKLGLLVSTSGFTSDAKNEELRYSESENRIALIGPAELEFLI